MNKILLGLTLIIIFLSACKKDNSPRITPIADFTINGDTSNSFTIGTFNQYSLINNSSNADSFMWDLGNGTTSEDKEIVLTYPKSGTQSNTDCNQYKRQQICFE